VSTAGVAVASQAEAALERVGDADRVVAGVE
jgi:hypothetical protein